jgi:hypothetical protein
MFPFLKDHTEKDSHVISHFTSFKLNHSCDPIFIQNDMMVKMQVQNSISLVLVVLKEYAVY